jgi:peptidoglycan hydrolase-like protein with peptidoglycan-binding domain
MPGFSFQSLFNEDPERQLVSGPGATSEWRIKPRSLMDEDADPRFPAFQQAWKQGVGVGDLFGPEPFKLQGTVSPSGGDNTRADVAKVQTLLGKAGYLDLGQDGPSGYANPNTDKAIRDFQKENGLQVDGVLKPGGPTIAKLGGLLGGRAEANSFMPRRAPFDEKPDVPDIRTPPTFPQQQANGTRKPADLLSILLGEAPEPTIWSPQSTPRDKPQGRKWTDIYDPKMYMSNDPRKGGITSTLPQAQNADPSTTATNAPFGSADGADRWTAGNMAEALLGRSDYADAVTHFRGEIGRNRAEAMPYLASVHQTMNEKNPELAAKFAGEMQKAGLADTPKPESGGAVLSLPIPATVTPGPVPPAQSGETDIRIPAEQKPEGAAVPAASTTTPAPAPTAPPDTAKPGTPAQPAPTTEDTTDRTPVQRDAEVLKDPANVPGYTKWLAEGAKADPQWAEQHAKDVSREVYKANPQAAEEMVRQGEKAGVRVGLYADGHQAGKTADAIVRDAKGGWVSSGPDAGSKECVALVKATVPELQGKSAKTDWRKGEDFKAVGDPPIKPGTALANGWDKNGKYPSKSTGNHALVYYGPDPNDSSKVIVVDQYAPKNGKAGQPATRHSWPAERLQGYSVIRVK